jgi:hypothetical protein
MLQLGDDWKFAIDPEHSRLWLGPRGEWGFEIACERREVKTSDGLSETLTPMLRVDGLMLEGVDWRELVGLEIYQQGSWRGEGDEPDAAIHVVQPSELREGRLVVTAVAGMNVHLELEAVCDVFLDDDHDTNVPVSLVASLPFDGVRFRFRAEGADSRDPETKAIQLLALSLAPEGFGPPEVEADDEPGVFSAHFPPAKEGEGLEVDERELELSPEERLLQESAHELMEGMIRQGWLELEDDAARKSLAPGIVAVLEQGGRGPSRANRLVDWLIEQDGVEDVHCTDDELASVLDKFW